ncbi:MAG TPA: flagellar hook-associated protein FlgK [Sedimentisphaerales bacterium]|jgi:flagellar hook-associated protein FlgK|nr:flagellar hook-associated protein FlgK [Sedimentisphaerales bacterium]HNU27764.1 flagellar hook-associated protein FlgK [Sedimentisphaerales bacterium]
MANYTIGLTGLTAATTALEVIGNNIANASTEGYHRQRVELTTASGGSTGADVVGAGVDVAGVTRLVNTLLEAEILRQKSSYAEINQELSVMTSVETTFGEFAEGGGLNATIDKFFSALEGLAAHPLESVYRSDVVSAAEVMSSEFQRLGNSIEDLQTQIVMEAQTVGDSVNSLIAQIAELNGQIQNAEVSGAQANNLRDQRDQLITKLGQYVSVNTQSRDYGVVDVSIAGLPVVTGTVTLGIYVGVNDDGTLGVFAEGSRGRHLNIKGGELGGLLALKNDLLDDVAGNLDTLAKAIIDAVNQYQVQGLGADGSFTELTGWGVGDGDLSSLDTPVTDGAFYVRVTNKETGEIERYEIEVNVSGSPPDTVESIAAKINALAGVSASVISAQLHIVSDQGYVFDFLPAVLPEPTTTNFTAASPATVSVAGVYEGNENQTLTFTVAGSGSVGNGTMRLDVTDEDGNLVSTLNIGAGYAAGNALSLGNGITVAVSMGQFNAGDNFEVDVFATTDTSGFLAAAGMNTFFSGASASEMQVCSEIIRSAGRVATAYGSDLTDNTAALRLAGVQDEAVDSLDGMTANEFYQRLVTDVGQRVALLESRQENVEAMLQNLENQRDEISGVDVNDEAAELMIFEKMFQAMAKYLATLQNTMDILMNMV